MARTTYQATDALRILREQGPAPLTIRALAAAAAVSPAHLSQIERGARNASPAVALRIAAAIGADRSDLFHPSTTQEHTP